MTTQFTDYYNNSTLAEASYATFSDDIKKSLTDKDFSETQASQFAAEYTVVDQYEDTLFGQSYFDVGGFSATVFKDTDGQYTLAIRGTDDSEDGLEDVFVIPQDTKDVLAVTLAAAWSI